MDEGVPVATAKSAVDRLRNSFRPTGAAFFGTPESKALELQRKELQEEISKLTLILEDEGISLSDDEIIEINDQINNHLAEKHSIELQLRSLSEGVLNYIATGVSRAPKFFGRAKAVKAKRDAEEIELKKRVFEAPEIVGTETLIQATLSKPVEVVVKKTKLTRFDDDD